jgi:Na+/proline symporter
MLGLHWLDWITIAVYFAATAWLGLRAARSVENAGDFFMGGRRFGRLYMIAHALGTGTSSEQPVTVAGATYERGIAGIWYQWLYLFATPFYWLLAPIYRRLRYMTMGDFFERRYGRGMGAAYTALGLFNYTVGIALMLLGTGKTVSAITGGAVSPTAIIVGMTVLFVLYSLAGGLVAAITNDLMQGGFIIVMSILLLPFAFYAAGGLADIRNGLPDDMWSFVAPEEITLFFVVMVIVNALVGIVVEPHHMGVCGAAKSELASRTGWTYGNFIKRLLTLGWAVTGVLAALLYPGLADRELAFGTLITNLLPIGLVGLMIACMVAALISTCDAFMVGAGALCSRNLYRRYLKPGASDAQQLRVGRISSVLVVLASVALALTLPSLVSGLKLLWTSAAAFGIAFWSAALWRGANRYGMFASIVTVVAILLITGGWGLDWDLPQQILLYLPAGFLMMAIVSTLTPAEPQESLRQFYTLLDTPVGREDDLRVAGVEVVEAGVAEKRDTAGALSKGVWQGLLIVEWPRLLRNGGPKFSFPRYRVDLLGFGAAWGLVAAILALGFLIAAIARG